MNSTRVLIADPDTDLMGELDAVLTGADCLVATAADALGVLELVSQRRFDVVAVDERLAGSADPDLLQAIQSSPGAPEVVVMCGPLAAPFDAARRGFLAKPFDGDQFLRVVRRAAERGRLARENTLLKKVVAQHLAAGPIISESLEIRAVMAKIGAVAGSRLPVLLTGETGTGKGLMAKELHNRSDRSAEAFLQVNCGALQETLFESELFGHKKGSFTGATESKPGLFEVADGGTLFLDEVGELKPVMQAKLLQVLDTSEVRPVGGTAARRVDVRVVAATNRDLAEEVEKGTFRRDLFYRLNVLHIPLPPLRERRQDVPLLLDHFLERFHKPGALPKRFSPTALSRLLAYDWPGNVRELANTVETAVLLSQSSEIEEGDLPLRHAQRANPMLRPTTSFALVSLAEIERQHILTTLEMVSGLKARAARVLGIDIKTLNRKLKGYRGNRSTALAS